MNYLNYLQEKLGSSVIVTEEVNMDYQNDESIVIIRYLNGTNYRDSQVIPIQLSANTNDINTVMALLNTFSQTYSNTSFIDGLEYVKQMYGTPLVLTTLVAVGDNYVSTIILYGTLVISDNVSDVKKVYIDGYEYETTIRQLTYASNIDNQRKNGQYINETEVICGLIKFTCNLINKGDELGTKLRNIRQGLTNINTDFTITLHFTDNSTTETYIMKLDSYSVAMTNDNMPVLVLSFIK